MKNTMKLIAATLLIGCAAVLAEDKLWVIQPSQAAKVEAPAKTESALSKEASECAKALLTELGKTAPEGKVVRGAYVVMNDSGVVIVVPRYGDN